jgi:transposase
MIHNKKFNTILLNVNEKPDELMVHLANAKTKSVHKRLMVIYLYAIGQCVNARQVMNLTSFSFRLVDSAIEIYRRQGLQGILDFKRTGKPPGRKPAVSNASLETIHEELSQPDSPHASYISIQKRFSELENREISYATARRTVRLKLKAKLKRPRPSNLRKNAAREEAIKKN